MVRKVLKWMVDRSPRLHRLVYIYGYGTRVPIGLLVLNSVFKSIFGVNRGSRHSVHYSSTILSSEKLVLEEPGEGTVQSLAVSAGCYIQAGHGIWIGNGTIWSANVVIVSANHDPAKTDFSWTENPTPVSIGRRCWIGANAVILPGVTIGDRTIVGAGAVVTKSFPEGNITLVGNPARPVSK